MNIIGTAKKFWCLDGFVAIIFSIFTVRSLLHGGILGAILMGIFSYWWLKRVLTKPTTYKGSAGGGTYQRKDIDIDL